MNLDQLKADSRFLFEKVPCEQTGSGEIIATVGRIVSHGIDEFLFKNRQNTFTFKITDELQFRGVQDLLQRNFIGLASLSNLAEDGSQEASDLGV